MTIVEFPGSIHFMSSRPSIPKEATTEVLTKSRRRCCICVALDGDLLEKQGQIAHLDHNPWNNAPDNLAYLCLAHHDRYDGSTSQSKGFTMEEIKVYRTKLWDAIERNLHLGSASTGAHNSKQRAILGWKERLVSVHRHQSFEGSMQQGWLPRDCRDYRVIDCDENCVRFHDTATGENLAAPLDDVKVSFDTSKNRLLLILNGTATA